MQLAARDRNGSQIAADSNPDGWARALLMRRDDKPLDFRGGDGRLQMMRALPKGQGHTGIIEIPESGDLRAAFMSYMEQSEQVL